MLGPRLCPLRIVALDFSGHSVPGFGWTEVPGLAVGFGQVPGPLTRRDEWHRRVATRACGQHEQRHQNDADNGQRQNELGGV